MALSACRAAFVPRHGTARKNPLRAVPGPPSRHDSTARPGTKRSSGLLVPGRIGPGLIVLGPCSGRAARLEYYSWSFSASPWAKWASAFFLGWLGQ
jgi:hypothetical protein